MNFKLYQTKPVQYHCYMQPIRDKILTKPYPSEEITSGGIIVPENCRETSNKLLIVAVGDGTKDKPMVYSVGQTVFRIKDAGLEVEIAGETHYLISIDDVLGEV